MTDMPPPARKFESLGSRSGTILGRYELVRRIGTGGMAEVYEAVHRGLKKTVAVKVLLPETAENPELRARFLREGEAASRIQHPHVVDVTDVGEEGGVPYLVMEFLEGQTLSQLINDSPQHRLTLQRALDILLPVAAALDEAHHQGVVHRDLKPENVFIARSGGGRAVPKILDFGVSKLVRAGIPSTTAVSAVLGTPHYMSPEQARGEREIDGRADQYSLALMVFECVTGTLPFRSDNVVALIHEVAGGVGVAPSALLPTLPPELDVILLKALSRDPEQRYESVGELAEKLLPFASARAKEAYVTLREKEPLSSPSKSLPPPSEITGSFGPVRATTTQSGEAERPTPAAVRLPMPTVAERPSGKAALEPPDAPPAAPDRRAAIAALVLVLLVGGAAAYFGVGRDGPTPTPPPAPTVPEIAAPPAAPPIAAAAEPERLHVAVVTSPATAEILLDEQVVGVGELERWVPIDGEAHRLTVRAEGFVERSYEFTDEAPPLRIELAEAPHAAPTITTPRRAPPPRETPTERPTPEDEDIRSTR